MKTKYSYPAEVDVERLRYEAAVRREVLTGAGCSTYALGQRNGVGAIMCLCCGLGSGHPRDIADRYCGFCHAFHSEWVRDGNVVARAAKS